MRVSIIGFGAIGGWIGVRMAEAGHEVSALARGATLAALRDRGAELREGDHARTVPIRAVGDAGELGVQDLVVIAVKGPALAAAAEAATALIGPETVVLPAMNGVPWWFSAGLPGAVGGRALASVDPGGRIAEAIPIGHVLGCVVHAASISPEPGVIVHRMGKRLIVGEPTGGLGERAQNIAAALRDSGFEVEVSQRIQQDIWYKLWGNMTMNPISAITGATCDRILDDPMVNAFVLKIMAEAAELGALIGCPITESGEDRNAVTRKLGAFKTSMLQDVEADRAIELDALLSAPREIAAIVGTPTPAIDSLLGLTRLFAQSRGLYA